MATIITPDRKVKPVKNLGWFFRKARGESIREFTMTKSAVPGMSGWYMRVVFEDEHVFETNFADLSVFKDVMNRQRSLQDVVVAVNDGKRMYEYVLGPQPDVRRIVSSVKQKKG